jgi:hypothetical protein
MWNRLEESGRLLVQACAMSHDFGFSSQSLQTVHEMIHEAVQRMNSMGHANDHDRILEAQRNLAEYVSRAVVDAQANNLTEIQVQTLRNVELQFCPVYPFT